MKLREKTVLIIGAIFLALILILYFASQNMLLGSFARVEEQNTRQDVERVLSALSTELSSLEGLTGDWSAWDDTYAFIEDANEEYIRSNLIDGTFTGLGLNLMMFVHSTGRTVFAKAVDLQSEEEIPVPQSLHEHLSTNDLLLTHPDTESSITGIVLLPEYPMLVASQPILTSEDEGPIRGTLIMGRYLDAAKIERLAKETHLSLTIYPFTAPHIPPDFQAARSSLSEETPILSRPLDEQSIAGYALLKDVYGEPSLMLRADMPRDIYRQGIANIAYIMWAIVGVGLVLGAATILLLQRQVLSPLTRISQSVSAIGTGGDPSVRLSVTGKDELSNLSGTINEMLKALQQSQEKLRESEKRYRLLAENVTDVICIMDMNLFFTYVTPSVTSLLGYSVEEFTGKTIADFLIPASLEVATNASVEEMGIENLEQKDLFRSRTLELEVLRKDGARVWVEAKMTFTRDADGKATGILGVLRDITERKQAGEEIKEARDEYLAVTNLTGDIIVRVDTEGRWTFLNDGACRFWGKPREELIGSAFANYLHPDDQEQTMAGIQRVQNGETVGGLVNRQQTPDGWKAVEWNSAGVFDSEGRFVGFQATGRDITERQRMDEKLQEQYEKEKELRQELELEMSKRVEFTRALVHELRTPLTSVMASSELLVAEISEEPWVSLATNIYRGASNLNNRIAELLDLARGELGMLQLEPKPVEPLRMLHSIADDMAPAVSSHKQSLTLDLPDSLNTVWADEDRLRQVLLNLINNASKFTPEGGRITLGALESEDSLIVKVQDNGRGIEKEEQERLFEPYHRLQSDRERFSGLGLGLALSKTLVELHGGKIWVESQKGKGSTFIFSIPLEAMKSEENTKTEGSNESSYHRG